MTHIYIKWHIRKQLSLVNISYFEVGIEHCFVTFWELWVFTVRPCYFVCSIETVTWYRYLLNIWGKGDFGCQIVPFIALLLLGFTLSASAIFYAPTYHQNKKLYDRVRMRNIINFIKSSFLSCGPCPMGSSCLGSSYVSVTSALGWSHISVVMLLHIFVWRLLTL